LTYEIKQVAQEYSFFRTAWHWSRKQYNFS